jgi:hypothetical protein
MSCQANCTDCCIGSGAETLKIYVREVLVGALGATGGVDLYNKLSDALTSIQCSFPINLKDRIIFLVTQISAESATLVKDVLIFVIVIIFFTLLLLVILIYITFFVFTPLAMGLTFFFSLVVIIVAVVLLYFGVLNIYNTSHDNIDKLLTDIENLLIQVQCSGENGLCCICSTFTPCNVVCGGKCSCVICPT